MLKSSGPDRRLIALIALRKLANMTARPLPINLERSWQLKEVSHDWKNIISFFTISNNDELENYRLVFLTSTLENVMDHILQEKKLHKDKKVNVNSPATPNYLTAFCAFLHCNKAFHMASHGDLLSRLERCGISE